MKYFTDKEIREELVEYVTNQFSHSYKPSRMARALLKSQNMTIDDLIVPLDPELFPEDKNQEIQESESASIPKKINPIPNQKELADYEWIYKNKEYLSPGYAKSFSKVYRSPTDNIIKELNGQSLRESRIREKEIWKNQILRKMEEKMESE